MPEPASAARWPVAAPRPAALATLSALAAATRRRRQGPDVVANHQLVRVRALLIHAVASIEAHRSWFGADVASSVRSLADLEHLPTTSKEHFRNTPPDAHRWLPAGTPHRIVRTSGSSGEPFAVAWSEWASWRNGVQRLVMLRAMGVPLTGTYVSISPPLRSGGGGRRGWRDRRRVALSEALPRDELTDAVAAARPTWLTAQPHVALEVGDALRGRWRAPAVSTHGSSTDDTMRQAITLAYGSPPLDLYGTAEHGQILWQCRARDLYHVNHELAIVEVVDDDGHRVPSGVLGSLAITNLLNPLQPIIRYVNGDAGILADRPCACGDRLPALARIEGRRFDWIVDATGNRVPPQRLWLSTAVPDISITDVVRYQVRQAADRSVLVEVVPGQEFDGRTAERWLAAYRSILGDLPIELRRVEALVVEPGARFRQFRSEAASGS